MSDSEDVIKIADCLINLGYDSMRVKRLSQRFDGNLINAIIKEIATREKEEGKQRL